MEDGSGSSHWICDLWNSTLLMVFWHLLQIRHLAFLLRFYFIFLYILCDTSTQLKGKTWVKAHYVRGSVTIRNSFSTRNPLQMFYSYSMSSSSRVRRRPTFISIGRLLCIASAKFKECISSGKERRHVVFIRSHQTNLKKTHFIKQLSLPCLCLSSHSLPEPVFEGYVSISCCLFFKIILLFLPHQSCLLMTDVAQQQIWPRLFPEGNSSCPVFRSLESARQKVTAHYT